VRAVTTETGGHVEDMLRTRAERDLLALFEKQHGPEWVKKKAQLILDEARALGDV
jgi:hypothetical protein